MRDKHPIFYSLFLFAQTRIWTNKATSGSITAPLLIVSSSFILIIYGLVFMLSNQFDMTYRQTASDQALYVAEAGIQYFRWHLAHAPETFTDDPEPDCTTEFGTPCHYYNDPQGKRIGAYALEITAPQFGSTIVTIRSTGWMQGYPAAKRTITVQYGIPSLTRFSFLSGASSWYGAGITVNGLIHSNNGIRMDGINNSLTTSAQSTYTCGSETGCSPTQSKPGVWGAGPNSSLWQFPSPPVDFDAVSFDFALMRDAAQAGGVYRGPSGAQGYRVVFNNNGTFDLYRVNSTSSLYGYAVDDGCQRRYQNISSQSSQGTYQVADSPIVFLEDTVWVEGVVNGNITVTAARFPIGSNAQDIWINNNLTYLAKDNQHTLGLIAQDDIYFTRNIPNNFEVNGALMAQNGKIIRHGYFSWCQGTSQATKNSLTIYGSILSNEKSYWNFGSGPSSGFITRTITYDANLLYHPPPYFPSDGEYEFITWEE